jgi:aldose 1-epimerase
VALSSILLRSGPLTLGIAPEWGGSFTRFNLKDARSTFDIFRPYRSRPAGLQCLGCSSFPMLPYAGRLRGGRFDFEGRSICYPLNAQPERNSSHGDGFTRIWRLSCLERSRAVMELVPVDSAPIQYRCTQVIELSDHRLEVRMTVTNIENRRIPLGIGLHPYFAHRADAILTARLPVQWHWDEELMPTEATPNARACEFDSGIQALRLPVAAQYADWDGQVLVEWPRHGVRAKLTTQPALEHVVVWAPAGEDFFCFEPINHATDSFNLCAVHPEMRPRILNPQECFEQTFALEIQRRSASLSP